MSAQFLPAEHHTPQMLQQAPTTIWNPNHFALNKLDGRNGPAIIRPCKEPEKNERQQDSESGATSPNVRTLSAARMVATGHGAYSGRDTLDAGVRFSAKGHGTGNMERGAR
jgi:hypothetical protein